MFTRHAQYAVKGVTKELAIKETSCKHNHKAPFATHEDKAKYLINWARAKAKEK